MLTNIFPNYDTEIAWLQQYAPSGFVLAFNMTFKGPEHLHNTYPKEWVKIYMERNYVFLDPVNLWTFSRSGRWRWSEVNMPDVRGVLEEAKKYGLCHGAIFSQMRGFRRSLLSVARPDRELTDTEIDVLDAKFGSWADMVMGGPELTEGELDVLRGLRDGLERTEIAERLGISESGVKQRLSKACTKLRARTPTQAVAIAVSRNYLTA